MHRSLTALFIFLSIVAGDIGAAQKGYGLYFDQDLLLPVVNEDRDYTMGVGIERFERESAFQLLQGPLRSVAGVLSIDDRKGELRTSYLFGSVNYTPDDLSASAPVPGDRPYASVLYLSNKRVVTDDAHAIGVELQVGLLGTYVAREIQRKLHQGWRKLSDSDEPVTPRGWGNQISAGGEPTLRLRLARSDRLLGDSRRWDLAGTFDLSVGYQTNASAGLALRGGLLRSKFSSLPYDPINRGNFVPAFGDDELYLWGATRARLVGYDALLQGQFRDSTLTYDSDQLRRLVIDAGAGVTGSWRGVQLTLSANLKTSELDHGAADRTQWWGGLYVTVRR